jgi:hypothetical protein
MKYGDIRGEWVEYGNSQAVVGKLALGTERGIGRYVSPVTSILTRENAYLLHLFRQSAE